MTARTLLCALALLLGTSPAFNANAGTYTVSRFDDTAANAAGSAPGTGDGPGTAFDLRYSILLANKVGGTNTIDFACVVAPCTITLNGPLPPIESNLTIDGGSLGTVIIDGSNKYWVFFSDMGAITLANLQIQNALAAGGAGASAAAPGGGGAGFGAGLFVNQSTAVVTVRNVHFLNCNALGGSGGAVVQGTPPASGGAGGRLNGGKGGLSGVGSAGAGGAGFGDGGSGVAVGGFFCSPFTGGAGGFGGGGGAAVALGDCGQGGGSTGSVGGIQGGSGGSNSLTSNAVGGGGGAAAGPAIFVRLGSATIIDSTGNVFSAAAGAGGSGVGAGGGASTASPVPVFNYGGTVNGSTATGPLLAALPSGTATSTHFSVAPSTYTVVSGTAYSLTVMVLDSSGNPITGYSGTVEFSSTNAGASFANSLSSSPNLTLTNGTGTEGFVLKQAGAGFTITATDATTASIFGTSSAITVQPGPVNTISVSAPSTAAAGVPFEFSVTATDAYGNTISTSSDALVYSSTDRAASLPAAGALRTGTNLQATLNTPGNETITVMDTTSGKSGASGTITVSAPPQFQVSSGISSLSFNGSAGSASFSQAINVTTNGTNVPAQATATTSSGGTWLSVAGGGTTPQTFTVTANPAGLAAGIYKASVTIASSAPGTNPLVIPVTLTIVAGAPAITINAFVNAGSLQSSSVAPNTILSAFGTFPSCTSAQVTVDGRPTTVFYSSTTQINLLIPASVAGEANASVVVACAGLSSTPAPLSVAAAVPALFTVTQNGSGQADSVNQDSSVDAAVAPGTVVELYGTGFGLYAPVSADGLTRMAQTVTALVGGVPAQVLFAGQAPGYTSGLQQIDIFVPANGPQGTGIPLLLTIGSETTQAGLTLSVQ